jgi:hypothetical protein
MFNAKVIAVLAMSPPPKALLLKKTPFASGTKSTCSGEAAVFPVVAMAA